MEKFKSFLDSSIRPEMYVFIAVAGVICLFSFISYFAIRRADPLRPRGLAFVVDASVTFVSNFINDKMGKQFKILGPYFLLLIIMIPLNFLIPLLGFPGPFNIYTVPLSFAFITLLLIHASSIRFNGVWGWFKSKFLAPIFIFFPINIIAFFAPLISLSFRLFGNVTAGSIIMQLIYWAGENLSELFGLSYNIFGAVIAAPFHIYFDIIGMVIQTMVFVMLTAMLVALEKSEES